VRQKQFCSEQASFWPEALIKFKTKSKKSDMITKFFRSFAVCTLLYIIPAEALSLKGNSSEHKMNRLIRLKNEFLGLFPGGQPDS